MLKRVLITAVATFTAIAVAAGGYAWWALRQFDDIPRFQTTGSVAAPAVVEDRSVTSVLLFSIGSSGLSDGDGVRLGIGRGRAAMADGLTDSIMLVLTNPNTQGISIVSIPRDTWIAEKGRRINAAYNSGGIDALLDDVESLTGVRAEHQVAVNFAAFADAVDAVGGVDIQIDNQVRDVKAKLLITQPGCVHLAGSDALAFSRARHWSVSSDGISWRADATSSDWGRVDRQQAIVRALLAKIAGPQLLTEVPALLEAAKNNLTLDPALDSGRILSLAAAWRGGANSLLSSTYPGHGVTLDSGAQVIMPDVYEGLALVAANAARIGFPFPGSVPESSTATTGTPSWSPSPTASPSQPPAVIAAPNSSASPSPSATATKPWRADNGEGIGGTKYPVCSGGHSPR